MLLSCVLLLCLLLHVCGGMLDPDREMCYSRQHRDVAVNTHVALDQKGTVMEARAMPSEKDCILTCCSEDVAPGLKCNLVVYEPAERPGDLNCHLFYYPSEREVPMMTAGPGVNTYNIFKGLTHPTTKGSGRITAKPTAPQQTTTTPTTPRTTPTTTPTTPRITPTTTPTTHRTTPTTTPTTPRTTPTTTPTTPTTHRTTPTTTPTTPRTTPRTTPMTPTTTPITTPRTTPITRPMTTPSTTPRTTPTTPRTTPRTTSRTKTPATSSSIIRTEEAPTESKSPVMLKTIAMTTAPATTATSTTQSTSTTKSTSTKAPHPPPRTSLKPIRPKKPSKPSRPETHSVNPVRATQKPTAPPTSTSITSITPTVPPSTPEPAPADVIEPESNPKRTGFSRDHPVLSLPGKPKVSRVMWKNSLVAIVVITLIFLTLILSLAARKAMESFDRRHYTRLELNDLHYEV